MSVPDRDLRYEVKFVGAPTLRPVLDGWILAHPAGFRQAYPPRQVSSVYFDSHHLTAFAENLSGTSDRTKLRFRWYGEEDTAPPGALEIKRKRNRLGWKHTHRVAGLPLLGVAWREIQRTLREQVPPEVRWQLDQHPVAVLVNRYWRHYWVSQDGRVRVTVDARQRVYDQRRSPTPNLVHAVHLPDALIVEVKAAAGDVRLVDRAIQGMPLRVSRHSKYVVGVQSILAA